MTGPITNTIARITDSTTTRDEESRE